MPVSSKRRPVSGRLACIALIAASAWALTATSERLAADSIYWANEYSPISHANLDGSGGADLSISGPAAEELEGIAIDPAVGKIYWANWNKDVIASASLAGGAATELKTAGATVDLSRGQSRSTPPPARSTGPTTTGAPVEKGRSPTPTSTAQATPAISTRPVPRWKSPGRSP